tara:strand:- start:1413 stop:1727 length:315 start_codon:yes stop_codon:yes gene_type:complete
MSEDSSVGSAGYNIYVTVEICKHTGHIDRTEDSDTAWTMGSAYLDDFEKSEFNDLEMGFQDAMIEYLDKVPTPVHRESAKTLLINLQKTHSDMVIKSLADLFSK